MIRWIPRLWNVITAATYGGTVGQPPFRLLSERPKPRRSRATVKLRLEELTDRILPSASALIPIAVDSAISPPVGPQAATIMSQTASAIDQWGKLIATDLLNAWNSLGQEIMHDVSYVLQQLGFSLGINPSASNQTLGTAVFHPGSGLGFEGAFRHQDSGSGIESEGRLIMYGPVAPIAIAITSPSNGATVSNPITVKGSVNPPSCTITCTITAGGKDYDGTVEGPDKDGNWSATFPTIPSGAATIKVTATRDGNSTKITENITVK